MNDLEIKESDDSQDNGLSDDQLSGLDQLKPDYVSPESAEKTKADEKAQSVQMVSMMLGGTFEVLAARMGDHWRLDAKEVKAIAVPAVEVMDKYMPDFENGPEVALFTAVGMVVLPRVVMQKQLNSEKEVATDGDQSQSALAQ